MILSADGIRIEKKFKECSNDYFRRQTIQLRQIQGEISLESYSNISLVSFF